MKIAHYGNGGIIPASALEFMTIREIRAALGLHPTGDLLDLPYDVLEDHLTTTEVLDRAAHAAQVAP